MSEEIRRESYIESYIAERWSGEKWQGARRFPSLGDAAQHIRFNAPFGPWRIVRLRVTERRDVLQSQPIESEAP